MVAVNAQTTLDDYALSRRISTTEGEQSIEARFWRFHQAHPEVYAELVRLARMARSRVDRVGIKMLWERLRWSVAIEGLADAHEPYLLNNNYTSRYSRLIMERERDLDGFFETREVRS